MTQVPDNRKYYQHVLLTKRERRLFERWATANDMAYSELVVFDLLMSNPQGMEPAQISERVLIYKQTLTRVLRNMADKGYIQQRVNEHDHRKKIITLTAKGHGFIDEMEKALLDAEFDAISFLSAEELSRFDAAYKRMIDNLERNLFGSTPDDFDAAEEEK